MFLGVDDATAELEPVGDVATLVSSPESSAARSKLKWCRWGQVKK